MNQPVNYVLRALDEFMKDNGLRRGEKFYLYNWRTKKMEGYACISNSYMISFNGEEWRNDRAIELLSGKYIVQSAKFDKNINVPRVRGFAPCSNCNDAKLPERATAHSAGYDFFCNKEQSIAPGEIKVIWTGIKAYMPEDEVLLAFNRSSNAKKKGLILANGVGVIDSDYYNNSDNEGEIGFCFLNRTNETVVLEKGEKLGQCMFTKFYVADNDITGGKRTGGFGSTGK